MGFPSSFRVELVVDFQDIRYNYTTAVNVSSPASFSEKSRVSERQSPVRADFAELNVK